MTSTLRKTLGTLALALGALTFQTANAAMVTNWNFSIDAAFDAGQTNFSAGNGLNTVTDQQISWGDPLGSLASGRSGLSLGNDPSGTNTGGLVTNDLGGYNTLSVTHHNNPISSSFGTLLNTVINSTLTLSAFAPTPDVIIPPPGITIPFSIRFAETLNQTPCAVTGPGTSVCNDIFVLTSGLLNFPFVYDGFAYFLNILALTGNGLANLTPLPANVCAAANSPAGCLGFTTNEGTDNTVQFGITITSRPLTVPEPGALALFGLALAGLAFARRRQPLQ